MTSQIARLWTVVVGVLVFFLAWAAIAAHPWQTAAAADPRLAALAARQQVLQRESLQVKQIVDRRWAAYRVALTQRKAQVAAQAARAAGTRAACGSCSGCARQRRSAARHLRPPRAGHPHRASPRRRENARLGCREPPR